MPTPTQLATARAKSAERLTETVVAELSHNDTDDNGNQIRVVDSVVYGSPNGAPARIKFDTLNVSQPVAGGAQYSTLDVVAVLPTGSPRIPVGADIRVLASTADELLVSRSFRVQGSPQSGQTSGHRYPVEEQQ